MATMGYFYISLLASVLLLTSVFAEVTESSDIRQSSAQAVAPTQSQQVATSPHPFSRQIAAPSRIVRRSITPIPMIRAHRVYHK